MNILIVGRGWTGKKMFNQLMSRGHVVTITPHHKALHLLNSFKYDWVVNCAGVTGVPNVDACENDKENTIAGNVAFPILLEQACTKTFTRLSHFSSGCIYQGDIHDESAPPNYFGSIYSVSKGVTDIYLGDKAQVYRIRMPFTGKNESKNYLYKIMNYAQGGKLVDFGQNSLTDLDEAINVAAVLIESGEPNGYYNLVNNGSVDMHELVEMMGIEAQYYSADEFKAVTAAGRSTCTIPAHELMSHIREALAVAIYKMKNT
jgi:dTDP-4-dehydrorhamnose reductase